MLVSITIRNFISYRDDTVFSLERYGSYRKIKNYFDVFPEEIKANKIQLLKSAFLFGGNATGKTNLLAAFTYFRNMVLSGSDNILEKIPYAPFELDEESRQQPTMFEVEFIEDNQLYQYHIEFNENMILSEKLDWWHHNDYQTILERQKDEFAIFPKELEEVKDEIKHNELAIKTLQNKNWLPATRVYKWFSRIKILNRPIDNDLLEHLLDEDKKELIIRLLRSADFNITDIRVSKNAVDISSLLEQLNGSQQEVLDELLSHNPLMNKYQYHVEVIHNHSSNGISLSMESDGTKIILSILLNILFNEDGNKIFLMDEFDDSLFANLAQLVIDMANHNSNGSQFIFTTHNLSILDSEQLSKDQLYLVDKSMNGVTELYSVADFKEAKSKVYKQYMEGKFGALPNIDSANIFDLIEEYNYGKKK